MPGLAGTDAIKTATSAAEKSLKDEPQPNDPGYSAWLDDIKSKAEGLETQAKDLEDRLHTPDPARPKADRIATREALEDAYAAAAKIHDKLGGVWKAQLEHARAEVEFNKSAERYAAKAKLNQEGIDSGDEPKDGAEEEKALQAEINELNKSAAEADAVPDQGTAQRRRDLINRIFTDWTASHPASAIHK
jgi:hypothetical protein